MEKKERRRPMIADESSSRRSSPWKYIIVGIALLVNATLLFRLVWGPQSVVAYRELQAKKADLLRQIAAKDEQNAELSREIRQLQAGGLALERAIRQRLNFSRENEVLYIFTDESTSRGVVGHDGKN